jgi:hypothetical protein
MPAAAHPPAPSAPTPRWLLLAHQLPARPSNARVKTWRRLQQLGAVQTRSSVYVLPNTEPCREDFEWMRAEIVALGGDATVFAADTLNADGERHLVALFQRARDADYRAIEQDAAKIVAGARSRRAVKSDRDALVRLARGLRERLAALQQLDFFGAPGRATAAEALASVERIISEATMPKTTPPTSRLAVADFQNRRWVTRPRPGVDRMASAWLIRRAIDPAATFGFADKPGGKDVAFDMYSGGFGHEGSLCTYEVLCERFGIGRPSVVRIGQIVHDLDMKETRYAAPEAAAVGRLVDGLRHLHADDQLLLQRGMEMFEALARSFESGGEGRRDTAGRKRERRRRPARRRG